MRNGTLSSGVTFACWFTHPDATTDNVQVMKLRNSLIVSFLLLQQAHAANLEQGSYDDSTGHLASLHCTLWLNLKCPAHSTFRASILYLR
ncbi:hypothetical protein QQP08_021251 [Theobroma cacao]|nr:hypothetical protein QQP08_021251 [Theobroma cacao]